MDMAEIKQIIKQELPALMQDDEEIRQIILNLAQTHFAGKQETESRFDRMLAELRQDREEQSRRWADQNQRWAEQEQKWRDNQNALRQYQEEQNQRWQENQKAMTDAFNKIDRRFDSTLGALGARWGLHTESSLRNALASILVEEFGVRVENITEFDSEGYVFGRPDQIELDLIIKNSMLIICEIKSSMSRNDMYAFNRKIEFYEKKHNQKASRKLVISPMVDKRAQQVATQLGLEVFSYADDIKEL